MVILTHKKFDKKFAKLPKKVREKTKQCIMLFSVDPAHPVLNNHALRGKWGGYRSINVTGDYRAVFKQAVDIALFVDVDDHYNLYGR
jgi:addiction module RelE/StbE family toxin